jgi:hypothetical protein
LLYWYKSTNTDSKGAASSLGAAHSPAKPTSLQPVKEEPPLLGVVYIIYIHIERILYIYRYNLSPAAAAGGVVYTYIIDIDIIPLSPYIYYNTIYIYI